MPVLSNRQGRLLAVAFLIGVAILLYFGPWRIAMDRRALVPLIRQLRAADVERLVVYHGVAPRGSPRIVTDSTTINAVLRRLQTGVPYMPNHDEVGGFERYIVIEPQHLALKAYESTSGDIIVNVTELNEAGRILRSAYFKCTGGKIWNSL